jgi:hypothetical protein
MASGRRTLSADVADEILDPSGGARFEADALRMVPFVARIA